MPRNTNKAAVSGKTDGPGQDKPLGASNHRNGSSAKTVLTDSGPVRIEVQREREGTRLSGHGLTRFENAFYCPPGRNPLYSEHSQWVPQYTVEEVMRAHAQSLAGVELRFNCELKSFSQDGGRVQAVGHDLLGGEDVAIEAEFLAGTDGARSMVREGIVMTTHR